MHPSIFLNELGVMPKLPTSPISRACCFLGMQAKNGKKNEPMESNWLSPFELLSYVNLIF